MATVKLHCPLPGTATTTTKPTPPTPHPPQPQTLSLPLIIFLRINNPASIYHNSIFRFTDIVRIHRLRPRLDLLARTIDNRVAFHAAKFAGTRACRGEDRRGRVGFYAADVEVSRMRGRPGACVLWGSGGETVLDRGTWEGGLREWLVGLRGVGEGWAAVLVEREVRAAFCA